MSINVQTVNPMPLLEKIISENFHLPKNYMFSHIEYDESVNSDYEYQIIRGSTHDGTLFFTFDSVFKCLEPIVNKTSAYTKTLPKDISTIKDVKYTIGDIEVKSDMGFKQINGKEMRGQTDIVTLPVRVEYIFN